MPSNNEPGSFGFRRKFDVHTGVDLYTVEHAKVVPCEPGIIVNIENYTGPETSSPWWLPTKSIIVEGESGIIYYGEGYCCLSKEKNTKMPLNIFFT